MSVRVVKHLGARSCPADDGKVLMAIPTFPGEKVSHIRMSGYFASGADSAIDQPGELNWYGISVPWGIVFATDMITGGGPGILGSVADIDKLYTRWLRSANEGIDQYYGGDVDADPEEVAGEEAHSSEELIDSGPIGVHRWFSREVVMQPLAAEGNLVIRFGDSYSGVIGKVPVAAMGSLLLFGVVRFEHAAETNFNVEIDDATSKEALGLLISGDYTKALARVEGDTGTVGDFLRTVLYGGDNYIEADTLKGPAGKAVVKAQIIINTPLGVKR